MAATQDYRDGVSAGARIAVERMIAAIMMGIVLSPEQMRQIADNVRSEYGGKPLSDAEAREQARVL